MKKTGLEHFNLHSADMTAGFRKEIYELDNPSSSIAEAIAFIARIAEKLMAEKPRDDADKASQIREIVRCGYCGSRYPLGIRTDCPNCGAG